MIDPLGGSYYVEALTTRIEAEVGAILRTVDHMGGAVRAIEEGYFQREIADHAYAIARRRASGEQPVVGVNRHVEPFTPPPIPIHKVDADVEARQVAAVREVRAPPGPGARDDAPRPPGAGGPRSDGQPHAGDDRAGRGPCLAGRDRRPPSRGVRHLRGAPRLLAA